MRWLSLLASIAASSPRSPLAVVRGEPGQQFGGSGRRCFPLMNFAGTFYGKSARSYRMPSRIHT